MPEKRFTEILKAEAWPVWEQIYRHPFLVEAKAGTLPLEKFRYYVIQDYKYLSAFARVVAISLAKAPTSSALESIGRRLATPIERPLHRKLMPMLGITEEDLRRAPISPTNLAYCNHMISAASLGSWATGIASLLPCPWTYHELGEVVGKIDHPVFGPWSAVYAEGTAGRRRQSLEGTAGRSRRVCFRRGAGVNCGCLRNKQPLRVHVLGDGLLAGSLARVVGGRGIH